MATQISTLEPRRGIGTHIKFISNNNQFSLSSPRLHDGYIKQNISISSTQ